MDENNEIQDIFHYTNKLYSLTQKTMDTITAYLMRHTQGDMLRCTK